MIYDILFNILLHIDVDNLYAFYHLNTTTKQICHDPYFLNSKFNQLPFKINKDIVYNLFNLLYINQLIKLAIHLKRWMETMNGIRFDFFINGDFLNLNNINNISPSLYHNIIFLTENLNHSYITFIRVSTNTKPNVENNRYGHIEFMSLMFKDGYFSLYFGIHLPHYVEINLPLPNQDIINYMVNIFLYATKYVINHYGAINCYQVKDVHALKKLIIQPEQIKWDD